MTILITGFGPFPGAPYNPTEPLVMELARRRSPAGERRIAHIFRVSYAAVDRELPALIAREKPAVLIMFGLAWRTKHLRIETRARNALTQLVADVGGHLPVTTAIAAGAPATLPLRVPAQRLLLAARSTGVPVALSHDAGRYLCNYLCWRATEASSTGGPRLIAFIHVPIVPRARRHGSRRQASYRPASHRPTSQRPASRRSLRRRVTLDDLMAAGEAIVRAAQTAARRPTRADS
jgi:pyroglutamyl-peptidase